GAIDERRRLRPGVHLVSLGDHFDYPPGPGADQRSVGREGVVVLRWLCEQPEERVTLLLGNHDACRVVELVGLDDDRFADARALAGEIARAEAEDESPPGAAAARRRGRAAGLRDAFAGRFPDIPTPELALRDFASYS